MGAVQTRNTALRKMRVLILLSVLSLLLGVSFGSDEPNEAARRQSFNQRPPPFFGNWPSRRQSDASRRQFNNPPPPFVGSWSRRQSDASRRQFNNPPPPFVGSWSRSQSDASRRQFNNPPPPFVGSW